MNCRDQHHDHDQMDYECIDPSLGEQLWRRDNPSCPPALRDRLRVHLGHCAACRLQAAMENLVAEGLQDGRLNLNQEHPRRTAFPAWLAPAGAGALAAGLAMTMLLPPRPLHQDLVLRGAQNPALMKPVPDQVILDTTPTLEWTGVPGITSYQVKVTDVDGRYHWTTSTSVPEAAIPDDQKLPVNSRFRLEITTVPGHLIGETGIRSSFRTGSFQKWLIYRLDRGALSGRVLGLLGLVSLLAATIGPRLIRRA